MSRALDVAGFCDMKRASKFRVLEFAIAASLALHILIAPFIRVTAVDAAPEQPAMRTTIEDRVRPKPTPRPTPTPQRNRAKPQRPAPRTVAIHPVALHQHPQSGPASSGRRIPPTGPTTTMGDMMSNTGGAGATAAPSPSEPTATPKPACTAPDVPAKTVSPVIPDMPDAARDQGLAGTSEIEVQLSASGAVLSVAIYRSSGSMLLDREALRAARASTYAPELRECHSVSGSYLFTAQFDQ